jgi:CubicO group peptidase (beta-lactamase class C family)
VYGVVLDGKLVHARSLGLADVERKIPATASTEFRIASMTKSFVAMASEVVR